VDEGEAAARDRGEVFRGRGHGQTFLPARRAPRGSRLRSDADPGAAYRRWLGISAGV
jgi:hypothetical protein